MRMWREHITRHRYDSFPQSVILHFELFRALPLGVVATVEGGTDVVTTVVSSAEGVVSTVVPGTI